MDRATQQRLFDEINGYFDTGSTSLAPAEMRRDGAAYYDPARLADERALLRRYPQIVGHGSQLANPGDFIAHADTGVPIIVSRQDDGSLKAFLNVCRHRGAEVCADAHGHQKQFTCPYHAWTFRNDGRLLSVPREAFPNLDRKQYGLIELPVEERHGLIWVTATPGLDIDIQTFLGPLDAELASYGMQDFVVERDTVLTPDINWKFVIDGFLEVYHFAKLHANSIAPWFYGTHSPFEGIDMHGRLVGVRKSFDDLRGKELGDSGLLPHVAVNYLIFPNTVGVWQGDHFEFWTAYPGNTPGHCKVRLQSITQKSMRGDAYQSRWDNNWKILINTVVSEDWAVSETVQRCAPFLGDERFVFGRNEPGMQHFHAVLDAALNAQRS